MINKLYDRNLNEINVGDEVVFMASGTLEEGYVYKIIGCKAYMTCKAKTLRPIPDAHKVFNNHWSQPHKLYHPHVLKLNN